MSYILDALRKAERERSIARVPNLMTVHDFPDAKRRRFWIFAGGLIICMAVALWLLLPLLKVVVWPPTPSLAGVESSGKVAPSPKIVPEAITAPAEAEAPKPESKIALNDASVRKGLESGSKTNPVSKEKPPAQKKEAIPMFLSEEDEAPDAGDASEKPVSFREAVSKMTISILVYAEAKEERLVFIDGTKYVEGDHVNGSYLLESITPDGAILSYQGDRVLVKPAQK